MAAEQTTRDAKLVQYLTEAYGNEKQLEAALEAHIAMTSRAAYKKRLRQHLTETKRHAREVEKRIKRLGGSSTLGEVAASAQGLAGKALAAAQGPLHMVRGTGEAEKELKNAKTSTPPRRRRSRRTPPSRRSPRTSATARRSGSRGRSVARRSAWRATSSGSSPRSAGRRDRGDSRTRAQRRAHSAKAFDPRRSTPRKRPARTQKARSR